MSTSIKIDDALKGRVQQLASQVRRSPHWIMLGAIQQDVCYVRYSVRSVPRNCHADGEAERKAAA